MEHMGWFVFQLYTSAQDVLPHGSMVVNYSQKWKLEFVHWDTTHTSYISGICENVEQIIRIQHHTNTVFCFCVDWNTFVIRHLVSLKLLKVLLPQNFQNYWKMSLHSWDAIFAQCWRVVLFASSIFFYGIASLHGNDSFPNVIKSWKIDSTVAFPKNQQHIDPEGSPLTPIINQQDIDTLCRYCYSVWCGKSVEKQFLAVKGWHNCVLCHDELSCTNIFFW